MAYEDWDREYQEFFDDLPITPYLDSEELQEARELFEDAFLQHGEGEFSALREEWWDFTGMEPADFDWEGWREMMGYND